MMKFMVHQYVKDVEGLWLEKLYSIPYLNVQSVIRNMKCIRSVHYQDALSVEGNLFSKKNMEG